MYMQRDVILRGRTFRIEIEEAPEPPRFTAHLLVVEASGRRVHPMTFRDGHAANIHATSERLALRAALAYLEDEFGRKRHEASFDIG
jgi:hypothetical protein